MNNFLNNTTRNELFLVYGLIALVIILIIIIVIIDKRENKKKRKSLFDTLNMNMQAVAEGKDHYFITQSDGSNTAKSPEEMFAVKIENDLAYVDKTIREYYGFDSKESEDKKSE